jgi:hypothetical protein
MEHSDTNQMGTSGRHCDDIIVLVSLNKWFYHRLRQENKTTRTMELTEKKEDEQEEGSTVGDEGIVVVEKKTSM